MKYKLENSKVVSNLFTKPENSEFEIHHCLEQSLAFNIKNNLQYFLTQRLQVLDKLDENKVVVELEVIYNFLVEEVHKFDNEFFEQIINESFELFRGEYLNMVKNHFFTTYQFELEVDYDHYLHQVSDYISSELN